MKPPLQTKYQNIHPRPLTVGHSSSCMSKSLPHGISCLNLWSVWAASSTSSTTWVRSLRAHLGAQFERILSAHLSVHLSAFECIWVHSLRAHLVCARFECAPQFRTGFRSRDCATPHLIRTGQRMQDSQVWPTMDALYHTQYVSHTICIIEYVSHTICIAYARAMYQASCKCIASQRSRPGALHCGATKPEIFKAPLSLLDLFLSCKDWKFLPGGPEAWGSVSVSWVELRGAGGPLHLFHVFHERTSSLR